MTDYPKALAAAREALARLREHDGGTRYNGDDDDAGERACCLVASWKPHDSDCPHAVAVAEFYNLLAAIDAAQPVAWLAVDCIDERYLCFTEPKSGTLTFKEVVPLYLAPQAPPATVPSSARGYVDDDRKRIVSAMQSMRDRLGGFLAKAYGDQFDGDIDTMLEAINFMKAAQLDNPAPVAVPAGYVPVSMLVEAREQVESWSAYAEPYFKDKWDLAGTLAKMDAQIAAARRGFERGLAARKPDRIWQDRNGALRTSPADCQSFGADGWPIAVYYGSQRFPISQHPLTDEETSHD